MQKSSLLQKLVPTGVAAGVLSVGFSMLTAPSANAANFPDTICLQPTPVLDFLAAGGSVDCLDKRFSGFVASGGPVPGDAIIEIEVFNNTFFVDLDTGATPATGPFNAMLEYMVEIIDDPNTEKDETEWYVFDAIDLDSEVSAFVPNEIVTKEIFDEFGNPLLTLTSINGSPDVGSLPTMPQKILVKDTVSIPVGGTFFSFENSFLQKKTPEPGAMLGLLAVGGLGLLNRKRQG